MENQEMIDRVTEPILREYLAAFKAMRETIQAIPDDEWTRGETPGKMPVRLVCHALFALDAKSGGQQVKASTRFGAPVGTFNRMVDQEDYPTGLFLIAERKPDECN
jgi:predicted transcriptional regulator